MAVDSEDKDRKVVPRWRSSQRTIALGELASLRQPANVPQLRGDLARRIAEWEQKRSFSFAADLLTCAFVLGDYEAAKNAAQYVLEQNPEFRSIRRIARIILGIDGPQALPDEPESTEHHSREKLGKRIHGLRIRAQEEPRNSLLWTDLALDYATVGDSGHATRAIRIALSLAPFNRLVLRSAARLYLHLDDYDSAHQLLEHSERTRFDPWLLAAEIAVASARRRTSKLVKVARRMFDSQTFAVHHMSELYAAVATLEWESGNRRTGRRLLHRALESPTENSVAQAAWIHRNVGGFALEERVLAPSHEAMAWSHFCDGRWEEAVAEGSLWLFDQPFSNRPASFCSFIYAVCLEDYKKSANIAQLGLMANPTHFLLRNNYVFSLIQMERLTEAREILDRIEPDYLDEREKIVWAATQGLLRIREGNIIEGRQLYVDAIRTAEKKNWPRLAGMAKLHLALEEHRAGSSGFVERAREAVDSSKKLNYAELDRLIVRVETLISQ